MEQCKDCKSEECTCHTEQLVEDVVDCIVCGYKHEPGPECPGNKND